MSDEKDVIGHDGVCLACFKGSHDAHPHPNAACRCDFAPLKDARRIEAPFTVDQVNALNVYQRAGWMHPFTCPRQPRASHSDGEGILVARRDGWMCPDDDYTQTWAHAFMAQPAPPNLIDAASANPKTLNDWRDSVSAWCVRKGWREDLTSARPNSAGDLLMLVVTELAEAMEEVRDHHRLDEVYYATTDRCSICRRNGVKLTLDGRGPTEHAAAEADGSADHAFVAGLKPEGVPVELADVLIRVFDMAGRWGIDLDAVVMAFNEGRPYKHGGRAI